MNHVELMSAGALALSVVALLLSVTAAWPTLKPYLEELRDLVLWAALAALALGGGWLLWRHSQRPDAPATPVSAAPSEPPASSLAAWPGSP